MTVWLSTTAILAICMATSLETSEIMPAIAYYMAICYPLSACNWLQNEWMCNALSGAMVVLSKVRGRSSFKSLPPCTAAPSKCSVKRLHCVMFVLVTSLCLTFFDADIEFDFVLMTSAYSQYLRDRCKQYLARIMLIGSWSGISSIWW